MAMAKLAGTAALSTALLLCLHFLSVSCNTEERVIQLYTSSSHSCGPQLPVETPQCKVVEKKNGYELREYPKGQIWVETLVPNSSYSTAASIGFYRLFYYFSGKNIKKEVMEMTAPVVVHPCEKSDGYWVALFAPGRFKTTEDLPKPLDKNVGFIETKEACRHAVLGPFGGFPTESDYKKKARSLKEALKRDEVRYIDKAVLYAAYSSPFELIDRKQEVHILVRNSDSGED